MARIRVHARIVTPQKRVARSFAAILTLGAIAGGVWFLWLPGHRPELRSGERYGIDVSHHQGSIAWHRVAADGISFAYLKASEGSSFVDPRFDANWKRAGEASIDRGVYHFFNLCSAGADQARNFLDVVPDRLELPPAVDLELSTDCTERPDAATARGELVAFLGLVEKALDEEVVLYVGDDFETAYPFVVSIDRPRWRLRFFLRPVTSDWFIWQVGSVSRVDGIVGPVGLDVLGAAADRGDQLLSLRVPGVGPSKGSSRCGKIRPARSGRDHVNALSPVSCSPITRVWTSSVPS